MYSTLPVATHLSLCVHMDTNVDIMNANRITVYNYMLTNTEESKFKISFFTMKHIYIFEM